MAGLIRAATGQRGVKCKLYIKVFEVAELPAPTPIKAFVEISRGSHKDQTLEAFVTGTDPEEKQIATGFTKPRVGTCMCVWEQELMLPVTMYGSTEGGYDEKEVKIAVKDGQYRKTIAKCVFNVAEHVGQGLKQLRLLLETKSKGIMGDSKDSPTTSHPYTEDVSEISCSDMDGDPSDDEDFSVGSPGFAAQLSTKTAGGHQRASSSLGGSSNPFDAPSPASGMSKPKKKGHRRANSTAGMGAAITSGIQRHNSHASTPVPASPAGSMNPFDDPPAAAPVAAATAAGYSLRKSSSSHGGDVDDLHMKIDSLMSALEIAQNDARDSQKKLEQNKKQFSKLLEEARHTNSRETVDSGKNQRIDELEEALQAQQEENEGLKMQVTSLKAGLEMMSANMSSGDSFSGGMSHDRDDEIEKLKEHINHVETELIVTKMELAKAHEKLL